MGTCPRPVSFHFALEHSSSVKDIIKETHAKSIAKVSLSKFIMPASPEEHKILRNDDKALLTLDTLIKLLPSDNSQSQVFNYDVNIIPNFL